jgi:hypothetical protein
MEKQEEMVARKEEHREEKSDVVTELLKRTKVDYQEPSRPEDLSSTSYKLLTETDTTQEQGEALEQYLPFYGRHVAVNNLRRFDNLVHLDMFDTSVLYDRCPTLRHRSTRIKGRALSSFQLHRANPEVGGFERKSQVTAVNKLNYDIKDGRDNLYNNSKKKPSVLSRVFGGGHKDE